MGVHNTDWNRHHGIGSTLLENWVEERAVGPQKIIEERSIATLSKNGHSDILVHGKDEHKGTTTQRDTYRHAPRADPSRLGKRRQLIEAELMKRAMAETAEPPVDRSAREWMSTAHADFSSSDFHPPVVEL
ncbi:hypothetical protein BDK51DRAFT_35011, partial [Blyttiomyces helicus]